MTSMFQVHILKEEKAKCQGTSISVKKSTNKRIHVPEPLPVHKRDQSEDQLHQAVRPPQLRRGKGHRGAAALHHQGLSCYSFRVRVYRKS